MNLKPDKELGKKKLYTFVQREDGKINLYVIVIAESILDASNQYINVLENKNIYPGILERDDHYLVYFYDVDTHNYIDDLIVYEKNLNPGVKIVVGNIK